MRRLCGWYRNASLIAVCLLLIPFVAGQIRVVVFPQLEHSRLQRGSTAESVVAAPRAADVVFGAAEPVVMADQLLRAVEVGRDRDVPASGFSGASSLEEVVVTANLIRRGVTRYAPGALVQTGPGLPDWTWNRYILHWGGPIEAEQEILSQMVALQRAGTGAAAIAGALAADGILNPRTGKAWTRGNVWGVLRTAGRRG